MSESRLRAVPTQPRPATAPAIPEELAERRRQILQAAGDDARVSRRGRDVLCALWSYIGGWRTLEAYGKTAELGGMVDVDPAIGGDLAKRSRLSGRTVYRAIAELEERGYVRLIRRGGGRPEGRSRKAAGATNIFRLLAPDTDCPAKMAKTALPKWQTNPRKRIIKESLPEREPAVIDQLPLTGGRNPPLRPVPNHEDHEHDHQRDGTRPTRRNHPPRRGEHPAIRLAEAYARRAGADGGTDDADR